MCTFLKIFITAGAVYLVGFLLKLYIPFSKSLIDSVLNYLILVCTIVALVIEIYDKVNANKERMEIKSKRKLNQMNYFIKNNSNFPVKIENILQEKIRGKVGVQSHILHAPPPQLPIRLNAGETFKYTLKYDEDRILAIYLETESEFKGFPNTRARLIFYLYRVKNKIYEILLRALYIMKNKIKWILVVFKGHK